MEMQSNNTARTRNIRYSYLVLMLLAFVNGFSNVTFAQDSIKVAVDNLFTNGVIVAQKESSLKINELGFGGSAIMVSSFNNQLALMNSGHGAATFNDHFIIGAGAYGIINNIKLPSDNPYVFNFLKMGYGGLELGYIFLKSKTINLGTTLLFGLGTAFAKSVPKNNIKSKFYLFPVFEPALYGEVSLSSFIKLHAGITYRFIHRTKLSIITDKDLRGPSFYFALLFGTCTSD